MRKLRLSGGLQHLWIIGVKQKQNLNVLEYGFYKHGGRFSGLEDKNTMIAEETV